MNNPLEKYYTPKSYVFELLKVLDLDENDSHTIVEPCAGDLAIPRALREFGYTDKIVTNDIDSNSPAKHHYDATSAVFWNKVKTCTWVITNPPFSKATWVLSHAYRCATVGVAAYLRLSWLAPEGARASFITAHPPTQLVILPRHSFSGNGKVDSVTGAWFIWEHSEVSYIKVIKDVKH